MDHPSSVNSKSKTECTATVDDSKKVKNDIRNTGLYPLINNILIHSSLPAFISFLVHIYYHIQGLGTSLWLFSIFYENCSGNVQKNITIALQICYWYNMSDSFNSLMKLTISLAVIYACIWAYTVYMLVVYKKKKTFTKWSIAVAFILFYVVIPITFFSLSNIAASSFYMLLVEGDKRYLIFLLLGLFYVVFETRYICIIAYSTTSSAILINTPFMSFDGKMTCTYIIVQNYFRIIETLFVIFPYWAELVIIVIHIIIMAYLLRRALYFPSFRQFSNVFICSVYTTHIVLDVAMFIFIFTKNIPCYTPLIIELCSLIICLIVYGIILGKIKSKVVEQLTYEPGVETTADRNEILDSLQLNSELKKSQYLRIGLTEACDMFVDCSLQLYCSVMFSSAEAKAEAVQFMSFFPTQIRKTTALIRELSSFRELNIPEEFLLYQVKVIKTFRASTASQEANEKLLDLRALNSSLQSMLLSFWNMPNPKYTFFEAVQKEIGKGKAQFEDAIRTYPNSSKIAMEYTKFLTEVETDFTEAIYMSYRSELIEGGANYAVDYCFKSFVRMFPKYITAGIVDTKGKIIKHSQNKSATSSSNNLNSFTLQTISTSGSNTFHALDADQEDAISKRLFRQSRMRIALHQSLKDRDIFMKKSIIFCSFLLVLTPLVITIIYRLVLYSKIKSRQSATDLFDECSDLRYRALNSYNILWYRYATDMGLYKPDADEKLFNEVEPLPYEPAVDINTDPKKAGYINVYKAMDEFTSFISTLIERAESGINIYKTSKIIMSQSISTTFCKMGAAGPEISGNVLSSLKDKFTFIIYSIMRLNGEGNLSRIYEMPYYCDVTQNALSLIDNVEQVITNIKTMQNDDEQEVAKIVNIFIACQPVVVVLLCFVAGTITLCLFMRQSSSITKVLSSLDQSVKDEGNKPIMLSNDQEKTSERQIKTPCVSQPCFFIGLLVIITAVFSAMLQYYSSQLKETNSNISKYSVWIYYASLRTMCTSSLSFFLAHSITIGNNMYRYINFPMLKILMQKMVEITTTATKEMNSEGVDSTSKEVNQIHVSERCTPPESSSLHDTYQCASANQQFAFLIDYYTDIVNQRDSYNGEISSSKVLNALHLSLEHLTPSYYQVKEIVYKLVASEIEYLDTLFIIIIAIIIVIDIASIIAIIFCMNTQRTTLRALFSIIKHLSPVHIIASKEIMDFLLRRSDREDDKSMSIAQSIIHNADDAIFCTSINGIIEVVNSSVSSILGYTPDQLLGQQVTNFFTKESEEKIAKQLELMSEGQSATVYDSHVACVSDSGATVNFHATVIGMKSEGSKDISSFVFVLTDETESLKQQQEAEEAKAKSEKLLYQILPKNIVIRLNRGESDISFTVAHATIGFIDIVKFSEYSSTLTPQEIMGNLSTVFASFDTLIAKYPILIKIKLIGDDYMFAGGLFSNPEDPPNNHAEDALKFTLDCLDEMETINVKLNASLEVRIGLNTGGPLIAGVLGTDKPAFDIIGDPINIAARLQSTDIPGKVQISQATKDLVEASGYPIEERGEVFLKGKGKAKTYLVLPRTNIMAALTNSLVH